MDELTIRKGQPVENLYHLPFFFRTRKVRIAQGFIIVILCPFFRTLPLVTL
jgi:hypothetical protein